MKQYVSVHDHKTISELRSSVPASCRGSSLNAAGEPEDASKGPAQMAEHRAQPELIHSNAIASGLRNPDVYSSFAEAMNILMFRQTVVSEDSQTHWPYKYNTSTTLAVGGCGSVTKFSAKIVRLHPMKCLLWVLPLSSGIVTSSANRICPLPTFPSRGDGVSHSQVGDHLFMLHAGALIRRGLDSFRISIRAEPLNRPHLALRSLPRPAVQALHPWVR